MIQKLNFTLFLLFCLTSILYAEEVTVGELTYTIDADEATATVTLSEPSVGDIFIPATISVDSIDYRVVGIDNYAFSYCSIVTSVVVPDGVTFIGHWAFNYCVNLTSISLPDGITSIGNHAFYKCAALPSIDLPAQLASIGNEVFYKCTSFTEVELPATLTTIGDNAFAGCTGITSVVLPDGVTSVGEAAFASCSSLEAIYVSEGSTVYSSIDGVLFDKEATELLCYPAGKECEGYQIPSTTTTISSYAFYECAKLYTLSLPVGVTEIGSYAFGYCSNLAELQLPDEGVTSLGSYAFSSCSSLRSLILPEGLTVVRSYAFSDCTALSEILLPEGLVTIEEYAFANCTALASLDIPSSLSSIEYYVFDGCTALASLSVATDNSSYCAIDGVLYYKDGSTLYVYPAGCEATTYTIPTGVTAISGCAFAYTTYLTTLYIPDSVTSLGYYAFFYCESLADIYVSHTTPLVIGNFIFFKLADVSTLHVPTGTVEAYEAATGWSNFDNIVAWEVDGSINSVDATLRVMGTKGTLSIEGATAGSAVVVYNAVGSVVYRGVATLGVTTISLPQGVYIVSAGSEVARVLVR